jgi:hypothetical protein
LSNILPIIIKNENIMIMSNEEFWSKSYQYYIEAGITPDQLNIFEEGFQNPQKSLKYIETYNIICDTTNDNNRPHSMFHFGSNSIRLGGEKLKFGFPIISGKGLEDNTRISLEQLKLFDNGLAIFIHLCLDNPISIDDVLLGIGHVYSCEHYDGGCLETREGLTQLAIEYMRSILPLILILEPSKYEDLKAISKHTEAAMEALKKMNYFQKLAMQRTYQDGVTPCYRWETTIETNSAVITTFGFRSTRWFDPFDLSNFWTTSGEEAMREFAMNNFANPKSPDYLPTRLKNLLKSI